MLRVERAEFCFGLNPICDILELHLSQMKSKKCQINLFGRQEGSLRPVSPLPVHPPGYVSAFVRFCFPSRASLNERVG